MRAKRRSSEFDSRILMTPPPLRYLDNRLPFFRIYWSGDIKDITGIHLLMLPLHQYQHYSLSALPLRFLAQ
ncbi:hypothetical protein HZS_2881 [Henneguya salminicola]|nr:hypothetical protein HZS_2881 [Henneguya salminicola]